MGFDGLTDDDVRAILAETKLIAVVGASNRPERPSYGVIACLVAHGYEVTPVNPALVGQRIHGRTVVASLAEARRQSVASLAEARRQSVASLAEAGTLDMVDIFRAADAVAPLVDDAVALGAKTIWMQLGIVNVAAAAAARAGGLRVVMDRCPKIELRRLAGGT